MIAFIKDLLFKDLWLKLFSLALAVLVWFIVNSMAAQKETSSANPRQRIPTEQRTFSNLPVVILSAADDTRSFRVSPKEVEVTVEGEAKVLKSLFNKDIRVLVDLTGIEAAHDLRKRIEVSAPAGVTRVRVYPEEVQVVFPPKT
jgi:YbbR domain-containing protein